MHSISSSVSFKNKKMQAELKKIQKMNLFSLKVLCHLKLHMFICCVLTTVDFWHIVLNLCSVISC